MKVLVLGDRRIKFFDPQSLPGRIGLPLKMRPALGLHLYLVAAGGVHFYPGGGGLPIAIAFCFQVQPTC
jgi:hypothetical protein